MRNIFPISRRQPQLRRGIPTGTGSLPWDLNLSESGGQGEGYNLLVHQSTNFVNNYCLFWYWHQREDDDLFIPCMVYQGEVCASVLDTP